MSTTRGFMLAAGTAIALLPAHQAAADKKDFAAGLVTGVIGSIIVNEVTKPRPSNRVVVSPPPQSTRTVVVNPTPQPESPQRIANRRMQSALNYFGFGAGGVDGVVGPQTEQAASAYQRFMGFPISGSLSSFQREVLVSAYERGEAGDAQTRQIVASDPLGPRALLIAQRDLLAGTPGAGADRLPVAATADPVIEGDTGAGRAQTVDLPLIPMPKGDGDLAAFCSEPEITGARVTMAGMTDPMPALNQAFCAARADSISNSDALAADVQTVSMSEIESQCTQLGPVMQPYVASLSSTPRDAVITDMERFVNETSADPAQLASTAEICLGTGYRMNDMDVAVGSALILVALGQPAYGELMGHHLHNGFGMAANQDRALEWLIWTTDRLAQGATPVFGTTDSARTDLVDAAVLRLSDR